MGKRKANDGKKTKKAKKTKHVDDSDSESIQNLNPHDIINAENTESTSQILSNSSKSTNQSAGSIPCAQKETNSSEKSWSLEDFRSKNLNLKLKKPELKMSDEFYEQKLNELVEKSFQKIFEDKVFYFKNEKTSYSPVNNLFEQKTEYDVERKTVETITSLCIACGTAIEHSIGNF